MNFPILLLEISEIFTPKKRPLYDMCESVGLGETLSFQMFTWLLQTKALCTVSPEAYIAAASERTGVCNCVCLARARASFMRVSVVRRVCVRPSVSCPAAIRTRKWPERSTSDARGRASETAAEPVAALVRTSPPSLPSALLRITELWPTSKKNNLKRRERERR